MGLFDSLTLEPETPRVFEKISSIEAFYGILVVSTIVDGEMSEKERERFNAFIRSHKFILQDAQASGLDGQRYTDRLMDRVTGMLARVGKDEFIGICAYSLPPDWKRPTFTILADLMFMDGTPCQANMDMLNTAYERLAMSPHEALATVDVIKHLHYFD